MDFSFDVVWVAALIVGIVEAAKEFGLKQPRILACALGFFFYGLSFALDQILIPEVAHIWIKLVVFTSSWFMGTDSDLGASYCFHSVETQRLLWAIRRSSSILSTEEKKRPAGFLPSTFHGEKKILITGI